MAISYRYWEFSRLLSRIGKMITCNQMKHWNCVFQDWCTVKKACLTVLLWLRRRNNMLLPKQFQCFSCFDFIYMFEKLTNFYVVLLVRALQTVDIGGPLDFCRIWTIELFRAPVAAAFDRFVHKRNQNDRLKHIPFMEPSFLLYCHYETDQFQQCLAECQSYDNKGSPHLLVWGRLRSDSSPFLWHLLDLLGIFACVLHRKWSWNDVFK